MRRVTTASGGSFDGRDDWRVRVTHSSSINLAGWRSLCEIQLAMDDTTCVSRGRGFSPVPCVRLKNAQSGRGRASGPRLEPVIALKEVATLWRMAHNFRRGVEPYRRTQKPEM